MGLEVIVFSFCISFLPRPLFNGQDAGFKGLDSWFVTPEHLKFCRILSKIVPPPFERPPLQGREDHRGLIVFSGFRQWQSSYEIWLQAHSLGSVVQFNVHPTPNLRWAIDVS